ncbi:MAG: FkbM family methyltransferase [Anaerolineae bacterium]|nr:FkbM family methyltransferase [Anaerolineae bacterium]
MKIVTSCYEYPAAILGYAEKSLLKFFSRTVKKNQTWLDIGAHYGFTSLSLCRLVGSEGHIFAFEPVLSTAGYLNITKRINHLFQLTILPLALSEKDTMEILELPIIRGMADSTFKSKAGFEQLISISLDCLWPQICTPIHKIDGIKIDVQGMEINVLAGMQQTLLKDRPILVVEIHENVNRLELIATLVTAGYQNKGISVNTGAAQEPENFLDNHSYVFYPR